MAEILSAPHLEAYRPTMDLRLVVRDGERVLQQRWEAMSYRNRQDWAANIPESVSEEWRDVPVEEG